MKNSFKMAINIMGDVDNKIASVTEFENSSEYVVQMPGDHSNIKVEIVDGVHLVQTEGIPLDSNTLYSVIEGIQAHLKK